MLSSFKFLLPYLCTLLYGYIKMLSNNHFRSIVTSMKDIRMVPLKCLSLYFLCENHFIIVYYKLNIITESKIITHLIFFSFKFFIRPGSFHCLQSINSMVIGNVTSDSYLVLYVSAIVSIV